MDAATRARENKHLDIVNILQSDDSHEKNSYFPVDEYLKFDKLVDITKLQEKIMDFNKKLDTGAKLPIDSVEIFIKLYQGGKKLTLIHS